MYRRLIMGSALSMVYVQRIHPIREADRSALRLNYLDARGVVKAKAAYGKDMGVLPSNTLHDSYLRSGNSKSISYLYPAWAEGLIAHPERNKIFEKKDLKDERTGWTLPVSYIPYEAFGRLRVGLHIVAERFEGTENGVIIHPKADGVTIIEGLIQVSGKWGKTDEKTKVPVEVSDELLKSLNPDELACFFRESEAAIRPIVRDDGHLV